MEQLLRQVGNQYREKRLIWDSHKHYTSYEPMPTWLLVLFGAPSLIFAILLWYIVATVSPEYFEVASQVGLDFVGLFLGSILLIVAMYALILSVVSAKCGGVLLRRYVVNYNRESNLDSN